MSRVDTADTVAADGRYFDPVWRVHVELTGLERALLAEWWVRRLAFVAHAGAAAITTTQGYSRLEHSLGVLALAARFSPDDATARAAALLHDVGHLPFSHTFEHLAGLDHHAIGDARIRSLGPLLGAHGLDPEVIIETIHEGSVRRRAAGALGIDHLDSFVRSGRAHGRTMEPAERLLPRLQLVDGFVETDRATADHLVDLALSEARSQCAAPNVLAYSVLRRIAELLLEAGDTSGIADATDDEFWALALGDPRTRPLADRLRRRPDSWTVRRTDAGEVPMLGLVKERLYLAYPTVDGVRCDAPQEADLPVPPIAFAVVDRDDVRTG